MLRSDAIYQNSAAAAVTNDDDDDDIMRVHTDIISTRGAPKLPVYFKLEALHLWAIFGVSTKQNRTYDSAVVTGTGSSPIIRGVRLLNDCQVVGRVHFLASDWSARD